jgi:hypothetical protein
MRPAWLRAAALTIGIAIAACGGSPASVPPAASFHDPGLVEGNGYRLRYALTLTTDLPAEIAGSYGIERRRNLALLALTLEPQAAPAGTRLDADTLDAEARWLTGERRMLTLARHVDPGGPTWLAVVEVRHRVPLTIEIRARATPESPELRARLTREFGLD